MTRSVCALIGLSLLLAACREEVSEAPQAPRPVVSENVQAVAEFGRTVLGVVSSRTEADLAFPVAGTIAERPVDAGALVLADGVLAVLDPTDFEASVRIADAAHVVAKARLKTSTDALDRAQILLDRGVDSSQDVERAQQDVASAQAAVDQADADGIDARENLENATLHAPQAGVVSLIYQEAGAELTAGQPVLRLSGTDALEVLVGITEDQTVVYALGTEFVLVLDANRDVSASGILRMIDPVANSQTRTRQVHIKITDPPIGFRLGALIRVTPASVGDANVSLPQTALRDDGTVWVVARPAGTVRAVAVTTRDEFGGRVLVTSGLSEGDEVIVKGVDKLTEGQVVGRKVTR